ncbi:MAG: hypothetical protein M3N19_08095, partial [Candidatus Eremiobacteraeota bacterium]|nr:hypothetical protein [Candidatus Eremiobacteraeota bacterium]
SSAGRFVPPGAPTYAMGTASLTIQIPARRSQSARRNPKWISPGSATIGVRVLPSPLPNPTPTEQVFALPSPGPVPTSTTLQVAAAVANDTFVVTTYDGGGHALSTGNSAATVVAPNATTTIPVVLQGVASGVVFSVAGSGTPAAWRVLTNLGADQTVTINAAPVDAQNNLIPGTLAAPAPVTGSGGVQLSTASIAGAATLTARYPLGTNAQGSVTSPLMLNAGPSALNVAVNADSYLFALNNDSTVQVIDVLTRTQTGSTLSGVNSLQIAATSGCSTGAFAVEGSGSNAELVSVAAPTIGNPTPAPNASAFAPAVMTGSPIWSGLVADNACNLYNNVNDGSTYPLVKLSGFDSTITANLTFATGFNIAGPLTFLNGQIGVEAPNPSTASALSAPAATGGPAASSAVYSYSPDTVNTSMLIGSASSVYLVTNTCSGQPVLQALSGGPALVLSEFAAGGGCCSAIAGVGGAAQANDGTLYVAGRSVAAGNPNIMAFSPVATIGNIGTPTVALGGVARGIAITPDQQFVCVLEAPTANSGQIEFFGRNPTPVLVGTVALSGTSAPRSFSIGP